MINADQVHLSFPGGLIGSQQVLGAEFVASRLRAFEGILQSDRFTHDFCFAVGGAKHRAAALVRRARTGMSHHDGPGFGFDADHSWSQKFSLRYFSALSHRMVTMVADSPRAAMSRASRVAADTLQPDDVPTSRPSSRARRRNSP